jgi:hypothetical protein
MKISLANLSVLGALLGALATFSGLVVVIFSVVALVQIHKQVDIRFAERYDEHRQALDKLSAQWATGLRYWTQSTMMTDLEDASQLMEEALKFWPSAPGARTEMLKRLYDETERAYLLDLIPEQRNSLQRLGMASQQSLPGLTLPTLRLTACLKWATLALDHEVDQQGSWLHFTLAKIYAMASDVPQMFRYLEIWLSNDTFAQPDDDSVLVILSAIHTTNDFDRLLKLWTSHFTQLLPAHVRSTLEVFRDAAAKRGDLRMQIWLVVPRHFTDSTCLIGITRAKDDAWSVIDVISEGERSSKATEFANLDEAIAYLDRRWIMLRPIPYWLW